jgi:hypothetical protein
LRCTRISRLKHDGLPTDFPHIAQSINHLTSIDVTGRHGHNESRTHLAARGGWGHVPHVAAGTSTSTASPLLHCLPARGQHATRIRLAAPTQGRHNAAAACMGGHCCNGWRRGAVRDRRDGGAAQQVLQRPPKPPPACALPSRLLQPVPLSPVNGGPPPMRSGLAPLSSAARFLHAHAGQPRIISNTDAASGT